MHSTRYVYLRFHIELGKWHITLFCSGFPILCCDAYTISLHTKDRSVGALAMESWPRGTGPCQGEIRMIGSR